MIAIASCLFYAGIAAGNVPDAAEPSADFMALNGSCNFEGVYASGCIEFVDGSWTDASMLKYCQERSKAGSQASLQRGTCARNDYNSICQSKSEDGSPANVFVNNMPAFICKKYLGGTLVKRPDGGWGFAE